MKQFKYDIAISLCQEDLEFAKRLVKAINPSLKVFFYADRQQELISQSGPEVFANVFKEESRLVVILSRNKWSTTFYTELEKNAIIDRIQTGYDFLFVIPMVNKEAPPWYPTNRIYANASIQAVEEIAKFIEFKVTQLGGAVKTLTLEEQHQYLRERIEAKKAIIKLQTSPQAISSANVQLEVLKQAFHDKSIFLQKNIMNRVEMSPFSIDINAKMYSQQAIHTAHIGYEEYFLVCQIVLPDSLFLKIVTTQDFEVTLTLGKQLGEEEYETLGKDQRFFYYSENLQGWALRHLDGQASRNETEVLFFNRDRKQYYDLINPLRSEQLIDTWFQKLLSYSSKAIERYV